MRFDDMPTAEDRAYESDRNSFELHRDKIMDKALEAHDKAMTAEVEGRMKDAKRLEDEAQGFLEQSRKLVYTGLMWRYDNGIED